MAIPRWARWTVPPRRRARMNPAAGRPNVGWAAQAILACRVGVVMAGEAIEPRITAEDVYQVPRRGSRVWRLGRDGRASRLAHQVLLAIDLGWDGDLDELSPMVA